MNGKKIVILHRYQKRLRKDAGVVDRDGLENRCTLTGTEGSNPSLSAIKPEYQAFVVLTPNFTPNFGR